MKTSLKITALFAALSALAACDDGFLTEVPQDFIAPENFFQNEGDAIAAVNAAYATFINLQGEGLSSSQYVGRNFWMVTEYPTEVVTSRLSAGNERSMFGNFHPQFSSSHGYLEGIWQAAYAGINRANVVIDRVPTVPMDETRRNQVIAEAKFLRALHYYWLAGLFGGVPLALEETRTIQEEPLPRATAQETWAQITKDLTEAAAVLPTSWGSADYGRATKGAALTLLGKAYLQSAAMVPELSGNNQQAVMAFREVMTLGYALDPNYASLFDGTNERSREIIFSIQNVRAPGLGGRITEWFAPRTSPAIFPGGAQNQLQAERPFYESYLPSDVRKEGTWLTSFENAGKTITWAWTSGIQSSSRYGSTGPVPDKYLDLSGTEGAEEPDVILLRYADVLLSLAEAINEASGPTAEAYALVNQVRARAKVPPLTPGLGKQAFENALYVERRWELALEMHGIFDMRRNWDFATSLVEANLLAARSVAQGGRNANASPFTSSVEKVTTDHSANIDPKWKLYPIPARACELNPALTQNPGWSEGICK
jgi:hypothetical protein